MTLLEALRMRPEVKLRLITETDKRAVVEVAADGAMSVCLEVEDVAFDSGGAVTLVHSAALSAK